MPNLCTLYCDEMTRDAFESPRSKLSFQEGHPLNKSCSRHLKTGPQKHRCTIISFALSGILALHPHMQLEIWISRSLCHPSYKLASLLMQSWGCLSRCHHYTELFLKGKSTEALLLKRTPSLPPTPWEIHNKSNLAWSIAWTLST